MIILKHINVDTYILSPRSIYINISNQTFFSVNIIFSKIHLNPDTGVYDLPEDV